MNQDSVDVARIDWVRVLPCLNILRAARMACSLQMLIPSLAAVALMELLVTPFHPEKRVTQVPCAAAAIHLSTSMVIHSGVPKNVDRLVAELGHLLIPPSEPGDFALGIRVLVQLSLFSFFGVAVCRSAACSLCRQQRTGVRRSLICSVRQLRAQFVSAAVSAALISGLWLLLLALRTCTVWTGLQALLPGLVFTGLWFVALLVTLSTIAISAGWLLSIPAAATDTPTGTDSLSRGINYVLSHSLLSAGYTLLLLATVGVSTVVLNVAGEYARTVISTAELPVSEYRQLPELLIESWRLSVFFSGLTITYLLLRRREDGVALREMPEGDYPVVDR